MRPFEGALLPITVVLTTFALYQLMVVTGIFDRRYLPGVIDIGTSLATLLGSASLWGNVLETWRAATIGFATGLAIAIPAGLLAGRSTTFYHVLRPIVEFLRPLPSVAMIPLVVLLWGPSMTSKAFLACFTTIWPIFIQTAYGVRDTNPTAIETARSFGLGEFAILRRVILPSALPIIATSIRIQASIALLVTITAEVALGGGGGLGILIFQFDQAADYAGMYALLIFIGLQGMMLGSSLTRVEHWSMPWHVPHRKERH